MAGMGSIGLHRQKCRGTLNSIRGSNHRLDTVSCLLSYNQGRVPDQPRRRVTHVLRTVDIRIYLLNRWLFCMPFIMKHTHWIILAVLLIAPVTFTLIYAREFLAVDSALDAGASYDYQAGRADFTRGHPYISFADRHNTLCTMAAWSSLGAAGYTVAVAIWRRKTHSAS